MRKPKGTLFSVCYLYHTRGKTLIKAYFLPTQAFQPLLIKRPAISWGPLSGTITVSVPVIIRKRETSPRHNHLLYFKRTGAVDMQQQVRSCWTHNDDYTAGALNCDNAAFQPVKSTVGHVLMCTQTHQGLTNRTDRQARITDSRVKWRWSCDTFSTGETKTPDTRCSAPWNIFSISLWYWQYSVLSPNVCPKTQHYK